MADSSLIAALLSPTAAAEMERRRQAEAGQVSANPFAKLLTESAKTAGGLRSSLGGLFGTELRSPAEIRQAGMLQAIQSAEGATLQEKLQNALPTIGKIDPAVAIQLETKIKDLGPQMTYKDIRMGTKKVTTPINPMVPALGNKVTEEADIRTGVFQDGKLIGYLGQEGQVIRLDEKTAKNAQVLDTATQKSTGVVKDDIEPQTVIDLGGNARLIRTEDLEKTTQKDEVKAEEKATPATPATPSTSGQMARRGGPVTKEGKTVAEIQANIISLQTRLDNTRNPRARKALQEQIKKLQAQVPEGTVPPRPAVTPSVDRESNRESRQYPVPPTEMGTLDFQLPSPQGQGQVVGQVARNPDGSLSLKVGKSAMLPVTPKQLADRGLGIRGNQVVVLDEALWRKAISNASTIPR